MPHCAICLGYLSKSFSKLLSIIIMKHLYTIDILLWQVSLVTGVEPMNQIIVVESRFSAHRAIMVLPVYVRGFL